MDTKANYVLIGLFVIILTAAMVFGFVWLSGFSNHKEYRTFLVYARGGVSGLNVDSPVQFNGVRVGSVNKIELDVANPQFVKLYLKIEQQTPITESTVATLIPQGITGLVYVSLKAEAAGAPPLKAEPGQSITVIPYEKPFLTQLTEVLPDLTKNLGEIAEKFKQAFSDQNIDNMSETLMHLETITGAVSKQSESISKSITSLNTLLKNTAGASEHFSDTLIAAQQAADQLTEVGKQINLQISDIRQQTMPDVQELIMRMNDTASNLQQVSQDLQRNPSVLIRGKQPPPPGPGEK